MRSITDVNMIQRTSGRLTVSWIKEDVDLRSDWSSLHFKTEAAAENQKTVKTEILMLEVKQTGRINISLQWGEGEEGKEKEEEAFY